jgi:hypothetical protein
MADNGIILQNLGWGALLSIQQANVCSVLRGDTSSAAFFRFSLSPPLQNLSADSTRL